MAKISSTGEVILKLSNGDTLTLRPPKGKDVREMERASNMSDVTNSDVAVRLLTLLSGKDEDYFWELDANDFAEAIEAFKSFRLFSGTK